MFFGFATLIPRLSYVSIYEAAISFFKENRLSIYLPLVDIFYFFLNKS
jgi:hypothetical protein